MAHFYKTGMAKLQPSKVFYGPCNKLETSIFLFFDIILLENIKIWPIFWLKIQKTSTKFFVQVLYGPQYCFSCKFGPRAKKNVHRCYITFKRSFRRLAQSSELSQVKLSYSLHVVVEYSHKDDVRLANG
jgi:hypothetical protein